MSSASAMEKGEIGATSTSQVNSASEPNPPTPKASWSLFSSRGTETLLGSSSSNDANSNGGNEQRTKRTTSWPRRRTPKKAVVFTTKIRSLGECRKGYPSVATFLDSDENFMIYRRFGFVQTRLLLEKQDDLRKLEKKLDKYDEDTGQSVPVNLQTRDLNQKDATERKELMEKLEKCFNEYATLISSAQKFVSMNRPSSFDYTSIARYLHDKNPLRQEEQAWIQHREDLVTLRPGREHAWLDTAIEHALKKLPFLHFVFCSKDTKRKTDGICVYFTKSRVDALASGVLAIVVLILLIVPIYILYHLVDQVGTGKTDSICIGTLLLFTLTFSAVLSLFTRALRHEILAAAAAYCAVLVVFLGNIGYGKSTV